MEKKSIEQVNYWFTNTLSPSQWLEVLGLDEKEYLTTQDGQEVYDDGRIEVDAMRIWDHLPDSLKMKIFSENIKNFKISFYEARNLYTIVHTMLHNLDKKEDNSYSTSFNNLLDEDVLMLKEIKERLHDYIKVVI